MMQKNKYPNNITEYKKTETNDKKKKKNRRRTRSLAVARFGRPFGIYATHIESPGGSLCANHSRFNIKILFIYFKIVCHKHIVMNEYQTENMNNPLEVNIEHQSQFRVQFKLTNKKQKAWK